MLQLPPPPRRVRLESGGCGLWFGRIFILPHTLIGIGAIGYLLFLVLWALFGRNIPGVVNDTEVTHTSKGGESYRLKFEYQVNGRTKTGSDNVDEAVYQQFRSAEISNITVRYFGLGPLGHGERYDGNTEGRWALVGFMVLWAGFWNGIMSIFWYVLWIKPLRYRWLYKHGVTTTGTVAGKRTRSGKSTRYFISYTYRDPVSGQALNAEILVSGAAWNQATAGEPVTVLYAPDKPKRSTIYEYGGYSVDLDGGI